MSLSPEPPEWSERVTSLSQQLPAPREWSNIGKWFINNKVESHLIKMPHLLLVWCSVKLLRHQMCVNLPLKKLSNIRGLRTLYVWMMGLRDTDWGGRSEPQRETVFGPVDHNKIHCNNSHIPPAEPFPLLFHLSNYFQSLLPCHWPMWTAEVTVGESRDAVVCKSRQQDNSSVWRKYFM